MKNFLTPVMVKLVAVAICTTSFVAAPALTAQEEPEELNDDSVLRDSGNAGEGIFHLNQSAADGTNQDNLFVAATVSQSGAAVADAITSQDNQNGQFLVGVGPVAIENVANGVTGLVGVNQSSASGSNQANLVAAAIADQGGGLASSSATMHSSSAQSRHADIGQPYSPYASMSGIGNGSAGVLQFNQQAGMGGAQANVVSVAVANDGIALADATSSMRVADREAATDDDLIGLPARLPSLSDSFNGSSGIVQVNQATGGGNAQANLVAAAFGGFAQASAISDTSLGEVRSPVPIDSVSAQEEEQPDTSLPTLFDGFAGVAQVSQVAGYGNQTANTFTVSVSTIPGN